LSVLLHGALVGVLVYGYLQFRRPPPPVTALAIDATVVSQSVLDAARRPALPTPAPAEPAAPSPPPEAAQAPPAPDPAVQQAARQAEAAHEAAAAAAEAAQAKASADREAARRQAAAAEQREAAEAQAKEKENAEREAQAKAKAKAAEEATARKAAAQAEAQAKAAAAAKAQAAANQADLQRSIAAEERLDAARAGGAMSSWAAQIQARIQRAWIRPPSSRSGLDCTLYVTQVPGGEIVNVRLGSCNGDDAVKQSILDAAYRASPLPPPPDPALFERNLELYFRPTD
jgi:colicin import membrane protein